MGIYASTMNKNSKTRIDLVTALEDTLSIASRTAEAQDPNTTLERLEGLAENFYEKVRAVVASLERTPEELLTLISQDISPLPRLAVARNPHAGIVTLQSLCADPEKEIRETAVKTLEQVKSQKEITL